MSRSGALGSQQSDRGRSPDIDKGVRHQGQGPMRHSETCPSRRARCAGSGFVGGLLVARCAFTFALGLVLVDLVSVRKVAGVEESHEFSLVDDWNAK